MTTAMLKAMAHPIRREIMRYLAKAGHGRAADVGAALGLPANQVSFHLRTLGEAGFIEVDETLARDRRDRVWKLIPQPRSLGSPEAPVADEQLGQVMLAQLWEDHQLLARRLLAWVPEYVSGRTKEVHGTFLHSSVRTTPERFVALVEQIQELLVAIPDEEPGPDVALWDIALLAADDQI